MSATKILEANIPARAEQLAQNLIDACPYTTTAVAAFALALGQFAEENGSAAAQLAYEQLWELLGDLAKQEAAEL